jgi:hypothetical protein
MLMIIGYFSPSHYSAKWRLKNEHLQYSTLGLEYWVAGVITYLLHNFTIKVFL